MAAVTIGRWAGLCSPVRAPPLRFFRSWKFLVGLALVLALLALAWRGLDIHALHVQAARLNAGAAFGLLTVLPMLGFPVGLLHFAAGIRFGVGLGLALVALSILIQLVAMHALVRWRGKFFRERFKALRGRIPPGAHEAVTIFTLLLPGAPYFAQNYTLAILGVPLRTLLRWAFPLHLVRATMTVVIGDQSDHLTPGRVTAMVLYAVAVLGASWWAYRRMQARLTGRPRAGNGRKSPA